MNTLGIILFDGFETLDVMGPVEVFGRLPDCNIVFISKEGNKKKSNQGIILETKACNKPIFDNILIPGGMGTRSLVSDINYIDWLKEHAIHSSLCMTVCTGSALLAKTNLLNNMKATSNKLAFDWVKSQNKNVTWQPCARWVKDNKFYTSSGISAGIDMSLQVINDIYGYETAIKIANTMEYLWINDPNNDPFC